MKNNNSIFSILINRKDIKMELTDEVYRYIIYAKVLYKIRYLTVLEIFSLRRKVWNTFDENYKQEFINDLVRNNLLTEPLPEKYDANNLHDSALLSEIITEVPLNNEENIESKIKSNYYISLEKNISNIAVKSRKKEKLPKNAKTFFYDNFTFLMTDNLKEDDIIKEFKLIMSSNDDEIIIGNLIGALLARIEVNSEVDENDKSVVFIDQEQDHYVFSLQRYNKYKDSVKLQEYKKALQKTVKERKNKNVSAKDARIIGSGMTILTTSIYTEYSTWYLSIYEQMNELKDQVSKKFKREIGEIDESEGKGKEEQIKRVGKIVGTEKQSKIRRKAKEIVISDENEKIATEIWKIIQRAIKPPTTEKYENMIKAMNDNQVNFYNLIKGTLNFKDGIKMSGAKEKISSGKRSEKKCQQNNVYYTTVKTGNEFGEENKNKNINISAPTANINEAYNGITCDNIQPIMQFLYIAYNNKFKRNIDEVSELSSLNITVKEDMLKEITKIRNIGGQKVSWNKLPQNVGIFIGVDESMINLLPILPKTNISENILPEIKTPDEERESKTSYYLTRNYQYNGSLSELESIISAIKNNTNIDSMETNKINVTKGSEQPVSKFELK